MRNIVKDKKMIIGITGSIGSGKTRIAKLFSRHWYTRIDADEISHQIMDKDKIIIKKLIKKFGKEILGKNKKINRKKLSSIVFNDYKKLKELNSIMHPKIIGTIKKRIIEVKKDCHRNSLIVIDAPLLLETTTKNLVDKIVVVKTDKKKILKRLGKKYPVEKILKTQMPLNKKLKYADFVVNNNHSLKKTEAQVKKIIRKLGSDCLRPNSLVFNTI